MADAIPTSEKTKRPANSAFKQQRLPAWQPILTAGTVLPTFFVIGILFIPVGVGLIFFSDSVKEISRDYTECLMVNSNIRCHDVINKDPLANCTCQPINFKLKEAFTGTVYIYYALTNFYQNHRRYVKSRDDKQLLGESLDNPDTACEPFRTGNSGKYILPCGAIANSLFSDEIALYRNNQPVPVRRRGIAWESDKKYKFRNPPWYDKAKGCSVPEWNKYDKPKAWRRRLCELEDGLENEDLIVWMRTAALPSFRKLYRIVSDPEGLPAGDYQLRINYSFPVKGFKGTKSVVISTTSLLGGKNSFLGICYVVVGVLCLILGIVFLFIHINYGRRNFVRPNETNKRVGNDGDQNYGGNPASPTNTTLAATGPAASGSGSSRRK